MGARFAPLKDDSAETEREQPVHKSRFPLHGMVDFDAGRRL